MPVGFDAEGREIVTFLPGKVGKYLLPAWLWAPEIVDDAGRLLRRVHDASVPLIGKPLAAMYERDYELILIYR
ncbi:hypothetical protein [Saccharibacillus endophyticus]|nr:hypothetical protein [Saccharibacillus endophyticus]